MAIALAGDPVSASVDAAAIRSGRDLEDGRWVEGRSRTVLKKVRSGLRVKYFFLSDGWTVGRVWEMGGLWNEVGWRRKPQIERLELALWEQDEKLWLYRVEEAVLMVEVQPGSAASLEAPAQNIGQVVLKRLITGDQVIERLCSAQLLPPIT